MNTLKGKVVIVTGASPGVGGAAALQFTREGATVVVATRREGKSQMDVRQIEALGAKGCSLRPTSPNVRRVKPWLRARWPHSASWIARPTMQAPRGRARCRWRRPLRKPRMDS
jgi:NAD(P)-dependent dehydrogenase (short-subunit alcohol dehydrogenase family)